MTRLFGLFSLLFFFPLIALSQEQCEVLAFPGAEGHGKNAIGGRGGEVLHVTNLNDSGAGSLRAALEANGPRIVVFDIEGHIRLQDEIEVLNPFLTIAGQTAPGEGIVISGARIVIRANHTIVRGLKSRSGDELDGDSPRARDPLTVGKQKFATEPVSDVIIDHNSLTWSIDESFSVLGTTNRLSVTNNIIAASLHDSIHVHEDFNSDPFALEDAAPHSKGLFLSVRSGEDSSNQITVAKNLLASHEDRSPRIVNATETEFSNNYVYNWGQAHLAGSFVDISGKSVEAALQNNYYESGGDTGSDNQGRGLFRVLLDPISTLYIDGNFISDFSEDMRNGDAPDMVWDDSRRRTVFGPPPFSSFDLMSTLDVPAYVLANAGARRPDGSLDAIDTMIVDQVRNKTHRVIDSQNDVVINGRRGFDIYRFRGRTVVDTDRDGMPDDYEIANSHNPNRADDDGDIDNDGYTNIEEYINSLIPGSSDDCDNGSSGSNNGGGFTDPTAPEIGAGETEFEDLSLSEHRELVADYASGGLAIGANGGETLTGRAIFTGQDGIYNIRVYYFDENDGEATAELTVNGVNSGFWTWNQDLGSNLALAGNRTSTILPNVALRSGDLLTFVGNPDGGEPTRFDNFDIQFVSDFDNDSGSENIPDVIVGNNEIENMALSSHRTLEADYASGGIAIGALGGNSLTAEGVFTGAAGVYEITVFYFDENDGEGSGELVVNGDSTDFWLWDQDLGSPLAVEETRTSRTISNVILQPGDLIGFETLPDEGEAGRIDNFVIRLVAEPNAIATFGAGNVEFEDLTLSEPNRVLTASYASGGEAIGAVGENEVSGQGRFTGDTGFYNITVHYFDENDGESSATLSINNSRVDTWSWNQDLGSNLAIEQTLTSRTIPNVRLSAGDLLTLLGTPDDSEPTRFDRLTLEFLGSSPSEPDAGDETNDQDSDGDGVGDSDELVAGTNPADPTDRPERLATEVCSEWNGFLEMFNFFEHVNLSDRTRNVRLTLFNISGEAVGGDSFSVEPGAQFDYPVNTLPGFTADSYGLICSTHDGVAGDMDGRMVFYRPGDAGSFQFAFASPMSNGLKGQQFVGYNTFQPSFVPGDQNNLVANWLQVTNLESSAQEAELFFYDLGGDRIGREELTLAPGERVDISGHQFGSSRVGLAELRPRNNDARFIFRNIRYIYDNNRLSPSFDAAFQLEGSKGGTGLQVIPVDTRDSSSIVELMNTSSRQTSAQITLRDQSGVVVRSYSVELNPKASFHLITDTDLGLNKRGLVTVESENEGSVLAVVMNYNRASNGSIRFMYGLTADSGSFELQSGSYNTFIGQESELLMINHSDSARNVQVELVDLSGRVDLPETEVGIPALGAATLRANDYAPDDTYGVVTTDSTTKISAWILRKRGQQYLIPTPVRPESF